MTAVQPDAVPPDLAWIVAAIRSHESALRAMGVLSLEVFGSVVHGDNTDNSDIDLLVEVERPAGLLRFAHIENHLSGLLGHPVDLIPKTALRPELRERVLAEARRVI